MRGWVSILAIGAAAWACGEDQGVPAGAATTSSSSAGGGGGMAATNASSSSNGGSAASGGGMSGCGEVDYLGYCDGDLLVWCEEDALQSHDCAADGKKCGWQNDRIGYNCLGGFGYPVGDKTTSPAGGWVVTQVLGHYLDWNGFTGGHLAHDIASGQGESATANAPVHSVADGVVLYAGPNSSTYVNVVLIQHDVGNGETICSFYGHLGSVTVSEGQTVSRGDQVATVLDWNAHFGSANSHLHYVLLSPDLCAASDAAGGALVCGYDNTPGPNGITDLSNEPAVYTSVGDPCGDHNYPNAFHSPTKFIDAHHH